MNRLFVIALMGVLLVACGRPDLEDHAGKEPGIDLVTYFDGATVDAWGQFQDRFGKVQRRFHVVITGEMKGDTLVLDERFVYDDGEKKTQIWKIRQTGPDTWEGTADGVVGVATGARSGNAINWRYRFDLPVGDGTWEVQFDDWLWQQDARVVINRAYVSRFGIDIGEVIITFLKREAS